MTYLIHFTFMLLRRTDLVQFKTYITSTLTFSVFTLHTGLTFTLQTYPQSQSLIVVYLYIACLAHTETFIAVRIMFDTYVGFTFLTSTNIRFLSWIVVFNLYYMITLWTDKHHNVLHFMILNKLKDKLLRYHRNIYLRIKNAFFTI
jgi:hypothetical protein